MSAEGGPLLELSAVGGAGKLKAVDLEALRAVFPGDVACPSDDVEEGDESEDDVVLLEEAPEAVKSKPKPSKKRPAAAQSESDEEEAYKPAAGRESESEDEDVEAEEEEEKKPKKRPAATSAAPKAKKGKAAVGEEVPVKLSAKEKKALQAQEQLQELPLACAAAGVSSATYFSLRDSLSALSGAALTALLKHNRQLSSGSKLELASRCAEYSLVGALPQCPNCRTSVLKVSPELSAISKQITYACPGKYSSSEVYSTCNYTATASQLPRQPWVDSVDKPQPPQSEAAQAQQAQQDAAAAVAPDWLQQISALQDLKAAATAVAAECARLNRTVPLAEIAGLLNAHREGGLFNVSTVMSKLAEKYPQAAAAPPAACAANSALAAAFDVLSAEPDLDFFKRKTFTLAAQAVRVWPRPIKAGKELAAGKDKVPGIGKSTGTLIDKFIQDGNFGPKPEK